MSDESKKEPRAQVDTGSKAKTKAAVAKLIKPTGMFSENMRKLLFPSISDLPKMPLPEERTSSSLVGYYWRFIKHFGKEVWHSGRAEVLASLLGAACVFLYSWLGQDRAAEDAFKLAVVGNLGVLALFAVTHLIRAPWLLQREPHKADDYHWWYGMFGTIVLSFMIVGILAVGLELYAHKQRQVIMEIKGPLAPQIETEKDYEASKPKQLPKKLAASNAPVQPTPQGVSRPTPEPTTQLDRLIEIDGRMTKPDREQFSAALIDYSQALDQLNTTYVKANEEARKLNQEWRDGSIVQDFQTHQATLLQIESSSKTLAKSFMAIRDKWKYYPDQTNYIFGDNPDNEGPNAISNATQAYYDNIDRWAKIQDNNQRAVLDEFMYSQTDAQSYLNTFGRWYQGCEIRLGQMKASIQ